MENRIIKFRAWDGEKMIYQDHNTASCWHGMEHFAQRLGAVRGRTPDVMQFTGLVDKNGVEIYQSDVVLRYDTNGKTRQMVVVWNQDGCGWSVEDDTYSMALSRLCKLEVIGSVFSNPELVNER